MNKDERKTVTERLEQMGIRPMCPELLELSTLRELVRAKSERGKE